MIISLLLRISYVDSRILFEVYTYDSSSLVFVPSYLTFALFVLQVNDNLSSESKTPKGTTEPQVTKKLLSSSKRSSLPRHDDAKRDENLLVKGADNAEVKTVAEVSTTEDKISSIPDVASDIKKPSTLSSPPGGSSNKRWGRTPVSFLFRFHPEGLVLDVVFLALKGSKR